MTVSDHFRRRDTVFSESSVAVRIGQATVFLFLLSLLPGTACCSSEVPGEEQNRTFLFRAEREDTTVYLLGSIHAMREELSWGNERIEKAYQSCTKIVFEADIEEAALPETRMLMAARGLFPEGEDLAVHLSENTRALLEHRLLSSEFTLESFHRFRPWLVSIALSTHELKRLGFDPEYGIDTSLYRRARKDGKEVMFLETATHQITMLSEMPKEIQEELLTQTLKELSVIEETSSELVAAWTTGNLQAVEEITMTSLRDHPVIYERLFSDRNRDWAEKIEAFGTKKSPVLVVMGAGHLVGDHGVLALLRKKGYAVEQM